MDGFNLYKLVHSLCASNQRGVALVEAVISIPLLIIFTFGMIDMAAWLMRHYAVSRISYEVSRSAASIPDLEELEPHVGDWCITEDDLRSLPITAKLQLKAHGVLHERAQKLLLVHNLPLRGSTVTTCYNSEIVM